MNAAVSSRYVVDTSIFIEAARRYYAFDIAPRFWQQLKQYADQRIIVSIDRVHEEIAKGKDKLRDWCNNDFQGAFVTTADDNVLQEYSAIMQWAQAQTQYINAAKDELAEKTNADAWVVAYAKAYGCIVVTHERSYLNIKRRIPIPNICQALGVQYIDTFEMMRKLGIKL